MREVVRVKDYDEMRFDNEMWQQGYDEGWASADDWLAQHEDAMAEHGWYRALDADKTPIRIGDVVDSDHHEDGTVTGVQFYEMANGGIRTLVAVRPDGWDVAMWYAPDEYHHHKPPTVEDVLREFGRAWVEWEDGSPYDPIAKFAAKLRLAGDAE